MNDQKTLREKAGGLGWAIGLAGLLCVIKTAAAFLCASQSLFASALDSFMDTGISTVNYLSVRKAAKPPDADHAYGHGKIESLAAYSQGLVILFSAVLLLAKTVQRAFSPATEVRSGAAIAVIIASMVINGVITLILERAQRRTHSLVLKAEQAHYATDLSTYLMLLLALGLVKLTGWIFWDLAGAVLAAGYIISLAFKLMAQASHELVDTALPESALDELDRLIRNHDPKILSYHEMRTRKVGERMFLDFHVVIRKDQSFQEAHELTESLIEKLKAHFPKADITVHEDPEDADR